MEVTSRCNGARLQFALIEIDNLFNLYWWLLMLLSHSLTLQSTPIRFETFLKEASDWSAKQSIRAKQRERESRELVVVTNSAIDVLSVGVSRPLLQSRQGPCTRGRGASNVEM